MAHKVTTGAINKDIMDVPFLCGRGDGGGGGFRQLDYLCLSQDLDSISQQT